MRTGNRSWMELTVTSYKMATLFEARVPLIWLLFDAGKSTLRFGCILCNFFLQCKKTTVVKCHIFKTIKWDSHITETKIMIITPPPVHPEVIAAVKDLSVDWTLLSWSLIVVDSSDTSGLSSVLFCNPNDKKTKHFIALPK